MGSDGTTGPIAITGVRPADPSKPPTRLELRDMRKNYPDQFNLLLLGIEQFKKTSDDDAMSYYQIAGIHGRPYEDPWPNTKWSIDFEKSVQGGRGYCTHSSCLFLTWHRPYLALFETALSNHAKDIASKYTQKANKDRYTKAAEQLRLPYWDWALPSTSGVELLPNEVLNTTQHTVFRPGPNENKPEPLRDNPLSSYTFQEKALGNQAISGGRSATFRTPGRNGRTAADFGNATKGKNLTERVRFILQSYLEFAPMSSNDFRAKDPGRDAWTGYGSLEDIHNSVHSYVGGQMGDPAVAAFDPLFWFHHCNIDRLFAIWQALHDDRSSLTYVIPTSEKYGNRVIPPDNPRGQRSITDVSTPLAPFTRSEKIGDYYNSEGIRNTKNLGYVYPETQDWLVKGKEDINTKLNEIYPGGSFANIVRTEGPSFKKMTTQLSERAQLHREVAAVTEQQISWTAQAFSESQAPLPKPVLEKVEAIRAEPPKTVKIEQLLDDNKYLEWLVDVRAQKHANNGDFLVHFFLGQPEDDYPDQYVYTPNHVATFSTFGQALTTGCEKCKNDQAASMVVTGQIPLTVALVERYVAGEQVGLDVPSVEEYLARNLHWRVTTKAGEILPRSSIPGLLIGVVTNQVTLPDDPNSLPIYAPTVVPRPRATTNANGDTGRGEGTGFTGGDEV